VIKALSFISAPSWLFIVALFVSDLVAFLSPHWVPTWAVTFLFFVQLFWLERICNWLDAWWKRRHEPLPITVREIPAPVVAALDVTPVPEPTPSVPEALMLGEPEPVRVVTEYDPINDRLQVWIGEPQLALGTYQRGGRVLLRRREGSESVVVLAARGLGRPMLVDEGYLPHCSELFGAIDRWYGVRPS
jgi:hypothetical protein